MRDYYQRNRDRVREIYTASRERHIERARAYDRARGDHSDPEKNKIRCRTRRRFPVAQPCEVCGNPGQRHHLDYDRPDDIRWLCTKHHGEEHRLYS